MKTTQPEFDKLKDVNRETVISLNKFLRDVRNMQVSDDAVIEKYIKENKIKISELEPKYDCEKCKDTGYIIENGLRKKCDCLVQEIININYNISNLKSNGDNMLEKFSFDYYSDEKNNDEKSSPRELAYNAYNGAKEFIENFGKKESKIKNMIFVGETGLRKNIFV